MLVGLIEADQHVQAAKKAQASRSTSTTERRAKEIPLGRVGKAEEFANLACFLASDAGSLHHRHRDQRRRRPLAGR